MTQSAKRIAKGFNIPIAYPLTARDVFTGGWLAPLWTEQLVSGRTHGGIEHGSLIRPMPHAPCFRQSRSLTATPQNVVSHSE